MVKNIRPPEPTLHNSVIHFCSCLIFTEITTQFHCQGLWKLLAPSSAPPVNLLFKPEASPNHLILTKLGWYPYPLDGYGITCLHNITYFGDWPHVFPSLALGSNQCHHFLLSVGRPKIMRTSRCGPQGSHSTGKTLKNNNRSWKNLEFCHMDDTWKNCVGPQLQTLCFLSWGGNNVKPLNYWQGKESVLI